MAKILTTKGSAAALEEIIRKAQKELFLISYSYIISDDFIKRLRQATERNVVINIVYGRSIKESTFEQLKTLPNTKIFHSENLHAKVFANEAKCIIGSMNFSEASELSNFELGVLLSLKNDQEAFKEAIIHCNEILSESRLARPMMPKSVLDENKNRNVKHRESANDRELLGYCIRTRRRIPLDHERPFCPEAYDDWLGEGAKKLGREKYDHFTGEVTNGENSRAYPILNKNWDEYLRLMDKHRLPF